MKPKPSRLTPALPVFLAILALPRLAEATATIVIVNQNNPNEGFNDPTTVSPVGGNAGITIGQQRLVAFHYAAAIWGASLDGTISISIQSLFTGLTCTATSGVLGAAGPRTLYASSNFPHPNVLYPGALASQLANRDVSSGTPPIQAQFNSAIGTANCLPLSSWYYGLDGMTSGSTQFDLVDVVLHEFGHGLGFLTLTNPDTGAEFVPQSQTQAVQDVWEFLMLDLTTNLHWNEMNDAQRAASARTPRKLTWDGINVTGAVPHLLTGGTPSLTVLSPPSLAGDYLVGDAQFGPPLTSAGTSGSVTAPRDGAGLTTGCTPPLQSSVNAIALIDRSSGPVGCSFVTKVKNAQAAGAIAVIIADDQPGSPPGPMGGTDPSITIPSVRITQRDGGRIRTAVGMGTVTARLLMLATPRGADSANRALLYTPDTIRLGSSVVHTDPIATLLMDPAYNALLGHKLDLTPYFMKDIGWTVSNPDPAEPTTDIALTVSGPSGYNPGNNVSYAVTVTNNGPSNAANVLFFSTTPSGITFVPGSQDCTSGLPCSLGPFASGSTKRFNAIFSVPASYSGNLQIGMNAAPAGRDPVTSNNAVNLNTPKGGGGCSSAGGGPMISAALALLVLLRGRKFKA